MTSAEAAVGNPFASATSSARSDDVLHMVGGDWVFVAKLIELARRFSCCRCTAAPDSPRREDAAVLAQDSPNAEAQDGVGVLDEAVEGRDVRVSKVSHGA